MYIGIQGFPWSIRLDQAKCLVGNQVKTFCNKNNNKIIEAPLNDHRAIGLVEKLNQTIKNRLACIEEVKSVYNALHVKHAIKIIIHQLRICKQKTTKILPFEVHFGQRPNIPLSVISSKPKLSNISYENIINHYLDDDTVTPEDILPYDKWLNVYRSDNEVEIGMTRATRDPSKTEIESTDGESRFLLSGASRPTPLTENRPSSNWLERSTANSDLRRIWRACMKS